MTTSHCPPPQELAVAAPSDQVEQTVRQALAMALAHHAQGHLDEAGQLYSAILQLHPRHPDANHNLGLLRVGAGDFEQGLPLLLTALEQHPEHALYWESYIDGLILAGRPDAAREILALGRQHGLDGERIDAFGRRLDLHRSAQDVLTQPTGEAKAATPPQASENSRMRDQARGRVPSQAEIEDATTLYKQARWGEMEQAGHALARRYPKHHFGWQVAGDACHKQGKIDQAVICLRKAVEIVPREAEVHNNLGVALLAQKQLGEAEASLRQALALKPDYPGAHGNLGLCLKEQGRLLDAEVSLRRALQLNPNIAEFHSNLATVLRDQGRLAETEPHLRRAIELNANFLPAYYNLGVTLRDLGRLAQSEAVLRKALELDPRFAEAHNNLGVTLKDLDRLSEAEQSIRNALHLKPQVAEWHSNLGAILQRQSRIDEAITSFRQALAIAPKSASASSNILFCLSELGSIDADTLFAEHCDFGSRFEAGIDLGRVRHAHSCDPQRPLRIGFVSADFRSHAVASFIEPILAHLANTPDLTLHAYYNFLSEDAVTRGLRGYFHHWNLVAGVSDEAMVEQIRRDGIDILIDLSGHTADNRLPVFAHKPAPVQVSWIGYPGTTGLKAMDYYLTDRFLAPALQFAPRFTEKLVYLPASAPFLPSKNAPEVNELPALANGYLTFGSFNRPSKISRKVVGLWAALMREIPDARMFLGAMPDRETSERLAAWFVEEGVDVQRLTFHARTDMSSYHSLHHLVDVCLDTFPYGGATTTLTALWMGVPTLALVGDTLAGRTGACILGHCGLDDFAVTDELAYVRQGLSLAESNFSRLVQLRAHLRHRFTQSVPSQPELIADGLAQALRTMWRRWCAGLPAESFEVKPAALNRNLEVEP